MLRAGLRPSVARLHGTYGALRGLPPMDSASADLRLASSTVPAVSTSEIPTSSPSTEEEVHRASWRHLMENVEHARDRGDVAAVVSLLSEHRALGSKLTYDKETGHNMQTHLNALALLARANRSPQNAVAILQFLVDMERSPSRAAIQDTLHYCVRLNKLQEVCDLVEIERSSKAWDPERPSLAESTWMNVMKFGQKRRDLHLISSAWDNINAVLKLESRSLLDPMLQLTYAEALAACRHFREAFERLGHAAQLPQMRSAGPQPVFDKIADYLAEDKTDLQGAVETALDIMQEGGDLAPAIPHCLIAAYGQRGNTAQVFKLFDLFYEELKLPVNSDAYAAVLTACTTNGLLESVPLILQEMAAKEIVPSPKLVESLLRFYIATDDKDMIADLMTSAKSHGIRIDRKVENHGLTKRGLSKWKETE